MSSIAAMGLCRVTIVTPRRRLDVSLPVDVELAHLLPTLLRVAGVNPAGSGESGWVLQRLGQPPFDTSAPLSELAVRDGEVLYLRPYEQRIPESSFDDVADVIASGIRERAGSWDAAETRRVALGAGATLLTIGAVALALSGPPWLMRAAVAGVIALLLLVVGASLSRALKDPAVGAVLGYCALPYGFVAGLAAPAADVPLMALDAPSLLAGAALTMLVATVSAFTMADGLPRFLGLAFAAVFGVFATGAVLAFGVPPAGPFAIAAALSLAFTALVPMLSFRLARLPLPTLPTSADDLRADNIDVDSSQVLDRTVIADRYATGFVGGAALLALIAQVAMAAGPSVWAMWMSVTLSLALLLRARVFRGRGQRLWLLLTGLAGLTLLQLGLALGGDKLLIVILVVPMLVAAAFLVTSIGLWLPGRRPSPFWGRAADILDILVVMAVLPLSLGVAGTYDWVRALVS